MAKATNPPLKKTPPAPVVKPLAETALKMPSVKLLCIVLAVLAFITYANTINNSYVLDDLMVVHGNTYVTKGFSAIPDLVKTPYLWGYIHLPNDTYRPLSLITLAIETQIFDINPKVNHFDNVLMFCGCVVFLFLFLYNLFDRKKVTVAFIAALLFAVHPIHTEVVANVKSRDEILCFLFAMLSLWQFTLFARNGNMRTLIVGAICYFFSLLSKETSIALLAIIPVTFLLYLNQDRKRSLSIIVSSFVAAGLFLAIRFSVLTANHATDSGYLHFIDNQLISAPTYAMRLATSVYVLGMYLKLLFVPYPLVCSYAYNSIPTVGFGNAVVLLSLVAYLSLLGWGVYRVTKNRKDAIAFGIFFFLSTLAIFTNFFFLIGSVCAERFLFFASVGFCLVLAIVVTNWQTKKTEGDGEPLFSSKIWMVIAPVALVFLVITYNRNQEWKDNYTLFSADVQKSPENARLNFYLGNEMGTNYAAQAPDQGMKNSIVTQSIAYLQKAVAIYPHFSDAQVALGSAFFNLKVYDSAEIHHKLALIDDPQNVLALNGLAGIYFMKNNLPAARDILIKDVAINPHSTDIVNNLGLCYMNMHQFDSGIVYFRKVLAIDPSHEESLKNMARSYKMMGVNDSVQKYQAMAQRGDASFRLD